MYKLPPILEGGKKNLLRIAHILEALTLIAALFAGGYATGQWITYHAMLKDRAELRADHLLELERMSRAHDMALNILANKLVRAADSTETAATATEQAAKEVVKATKHANKKVSAEMINRSVEQANSLKK